MKGRLCEDLQERAQRMDRGVCKSQLDWRTKQMVELNCQNTGKEGLCPRGSPLCPKASTYPNRS
eukprot:1160808-Pelagomonas_calceolata.AAC.41